MYKMSIKFKPISINYNCNFLVGRTQNCEYEDQRIKLSISWVFPLNAEFRITSIGEQSITYQQVDWLAV